MDGLMPVLKQVAVSGLIAQATRRSRWDDLGGAGIIILSGFMIFLAAIFAALALYQQLEAMYGAAVAYAVLAAVVATVSATLFLYGRSLMNRRRRSAMRHSEEEMARIIDVITEELPKGIAGPVRDNPKLSLAAAALAGILVGDRLR